ncbi:MAG: hypothetical protein ACTTK1_05510 [Candidatus Cryptobacteroides sp.]
MDITTIVDSFQQSIYELQRQLDSLKAAYAKANTNGTFKMWVYPYLMRTYNIDINSALAVMRTLTEL